MRNWLNTLDSSDVLLALGALLIVRGVSMISLPAAWIVAGMFLITYAYLIANEKAKHASTAKLPDTNE